MRSQVFWCVGMYGSASTWFFNLVRQISSSAQPKPVQSHFFSGAGSLSALDALDQVHVVKTHEVRDAGTLAGLMLQADKILVTVRDPRDAVASLLTYHHYEFDRALAYVEASLDLCLEVSADPRADLLAYESAFFDEPATVGRVASHLGLALTPDQTQGIFAASRRAVIEQHIANLPRLPGVLQNKASGDMLDPNTHWHSYHAGRTGEIGRWRQVLTPVQAEAAARRLAAYSSMALKRSRQLASPR